MRDSKNRYGIGEDEEDLHRFKYNAVDSSFILWHKMISPGIPRGYLSCKIYRTETNACVSGLMISKILLLCQDDWKSKSIGAIGDDVEMYLKPPDWIICKQKYSKLTFKHIVIWSIMCDESMNKENCNNEYKKLFSMAMRFDGILQIFICSFVYHCFVDPNCV